MVHLHFGQDKSYGERMCYVRFAAATDLPVVGLFSIVIGATNLVDLLLIQIAM
jgi:hypothetical protein